MRNRLTPLIHKLTNYRTGLSPLDTDLLKAARDVKIFLNNSPDLIFTRADKGNTTVALNRLEYVRRMELLLADDNTYLRVVKDPTRKIVRSLHAILAYWKKENFISEAMYRRLNCTDGVLPRAYGLPKIHKPGAPLRVIISSINTPLYELALFLHKNICNSIPSAKSNIKNSFDLVDSISTVKLPSDYKLISLDVVSLFTNIPIDLALQSISRRWNYIEKNCAIPHDEFIKAVKFVLESTFFNFNGSCYRQTYGSPMGSPLSPVIADVVMQDLEDGVVGTLGFDLPFYYRVVDDILTAVPSSSNILQIFNSLHPRLQFTIEEEAENRLNFLDVTLIRVDNNVICDWYHKPTFSGRYLNYESRHPPSQKRGLIFCLVDRAFRLSHPVFHQKNIEMVVNILLRNCYPLDFIFTHLRSRLKMLCSTYNNNKKSIQPEDGSAREKKKFFSIPYIPGISERFKPVISTLDTTLTYTGLNKLNRFVRVQKDSLHNLVRNNVVYKISCRDCDASYIGQTGRLLKTRVNEHRSHIRRSSAQRSVITDHRISHNHDFDWDSVTILDEERIYRKRLLSEMIHIKRQKNGLNSQDDAENLHHAYHTIIQKLKEI